MSNDEQDRASGSVPNAFGNALAWRWMRHMPASLKRSNLHTLLYTLRAIANADGTLRDKKSKQPFRIKDIARAAGADEKDVRDRLEAAIRAGVIAVGSERRRGRSALYVLVPSPRPDWAAAAAYLDGVKALREDARKARAAKKGTERKAAPWADENGGRSPELETDENGGPTPELTDGTDLGERGAVPRLRTGGGPPNGSGGGPPNNPGVLPRGSHDGADLGSQPQPLGPPESQDHDSHEDHTADGDTTGWTLCARCNDPMLPRYGRTTHAHCQPLTEPERTAS